MAYKVIILYQLYMPSYFLGTFTEYPEAGGLSIYIGLITQSQIFDFGDHFFLLKIQKN